jgi:hypothetical protein
MKMLFLRDFGGLSGGHLKYFDYLRHTASLGGIEPELFLTATSSTDATNPFLAAGVPILKDLGPSDSYFIAGMDWGLLDAAGVDPGSKPVINLVQGLSHADPADPKFAYLSRSALRICVSAEVEQALRATGRVAGQIRTIENGVDLEALLALTHRHERSGVFISGYKAAQCGQAVARQLRNVVGVDLTETFIERTEFLDRIARSRLCVLLPSSKEGFFLPALEAMALGTPLIVPDCIGNRAFCLHGHTCLVPPYDVDSIVRAVRELIGNEPLLATIASGGRAMADAHTLGRERELYKAILAEYLPAANRA